MKRLSACVILLTLMNYSSGQDYRIQDPIKNFERLWGKFDGRYAFFELKNVDWQAIHEKYRPLINKNTSNDSLFTVCNAMLKELKDGHVNLIYHKKGKIIRRSDDATPSVLSSNFSMSRDAQPNVYQLFETTKSTLNDNGFGEFEIAKGHLLRYAVSDDYGYLLISAMQGFRLGELSRFMDNAVRAFADKKGVIIDIRTNGGGMDGNSHIISGRFADKKRIGYYKHQRKKGTNSYTKLKTKYLKPKGKRQFTKPVVILTSDHTASAADVFALMMKELPYVTIIGDRTQGIFSDMYSFKLPNGWNATLSHQRYLSSEKVNYEGRGVQPDIKLLNQPEDIKTNIDPLIVKAIDVLDKKK